MKPNPIDHAAYAVEAAKARLSEAQQELNDAEQALIALVTVKPEGDATTKTTFYKVTTTGRVNRTINESKVVDIMNLVPGELFNSVFPFRPTLSLTGLRQAEVSIHWPIISQAITSKPGKTGIKIERIEP